MGPHRTVLLAEDEPRVLDALGFALRRRGYHVLTARDGDRAAGLLARTLPHAAVFGMLLPGQSGFRLTRLVKERSDGRVPVVMTSGPMSTAHRDYALAVGADVFLVRPFAPKALLAVVESLCPLPAGVRLAGTGTIPWPLATPA